MTIKIPDSEFAYDCNQYSFDEGNENCDSLSYVTCNSTSSLDNLSLFIKSLSGKTVVLNNLCSTMTVNHLKRLIEEKDSSTLFSYSSGYPHLYIQKNQHRQYLHMDDDSYLGTFGLQKDDTIYVTAGLLGGMPPKRTAVVKKADKSGVDIDDELPEAEKITPPKRSARAGKSEKSVVNTEESEEPVSLKKGLQQAETEVLSDDEGETGGSEEGTSEEEEFKEEEEDYDEEEEEEVSPNTERAPPRAHTRADINNGNSTVNTAVEKVSAGAGARRVAANADYSGNLGSTSSVSSTRSLAPSGGRGTNAVAKNIVKDIPKENAKEMNKKGRKPNDGLDKKEVLEQIKSNKSHVNYHFLMALLETHDRQKSGPAKNAVFNVIRQIFLLEGKVRSMNDLDGVTGMGEKTKPLVEQALNPTSAPFEKGQSTVINDGEETKKRTFKAPAGSVRVMPE